MGKGCSLSLTLNHLQYHIHDMLVTGSSALSAEDTIHEEAPATRTNDSCNPPPRPAPNPVFWGTCHTHSLDLGPVSKADRELLGTPSLGQCAAPLEKMSFLENPLALGSTHHYSLSPRLSWHASISHQSSGSGKPGIALHSWGARIPAGARVSWLSTNSLLPWDHIE